MFTSATSRIFRYNSGGQHEASLVGGTQITTYFDGGNRNNGVFIIAPPQYFNVTSKCEQGKNFRLTNTYTINRELRTPTGSSTEGAVDPIDTNPSFSDIGEIEFLYFCAWKREITDNEALNFQRNPFSVLKCQ